MGSQVRILSIRLAWEYRFPWISPGREDARAVRPAAPAGGINTSVTTGKKGRRALANAGIQAPSGVQAPDVHSEASHPSFGWRTTRHRRATYPKKARPCGCGAVVARLLPKQETAGSNPVIRSIREHWFSMYFIPRFRAGGPGDARTPGAGRQYAPYAPLVQRSEQRTFNPRATGPNPVGGTMLGTSPCISASIYYQIGCGNFFFRPRAKQGKENTQCDGPGKGL